MIKKLAERSQFLRFLLVGGSGYVVNLLVFSALVWFMGPLTSAVVAFVFSASYNFYLNRKWTFKVAAKRGQVIKFLIVILTSIALNLLLLSWFINFMPEIASQALAVAITAPLNFLGNKLWSFYDHSPHS